MALKGMVGRRERLAAAARTDLKSKLYKCMCVLCERASCSTGIVSQVVRSSHCLAIPC